MIYRDRQRWIREKKVQNRVGLEPLDDKAWALQLPVNEALSADLAEVMIVLPIKQKCSSS